MIHSAFPNTTDNPRSNFKQSAGMSLSEYYAGQALVGLATRGGHPEAIAGEAFRIARAMMAEKLKADETYG